METNDWLDEVLYQTIPSLDLAMLCKLETQAVQEEYDFSAGFEKRMRRLIREERRKWRTEDRGMKDREPETTHIRWPSFPKRKLIPVLLLILLALTATAALAANFKKIVQRFHWYDESQGADVYDYKSNQRIETDSVSWSYPSYMPPGYELKETTKRELDFFMRLSLRYENEDGAAIRYEMSILGDRTMYFDAEYDSSETIEINRMSWFTTWREEHYWMARAQKGDVFYLVSGPPELPREELIKILEGIVPADRDTEEFEREVEDHEEAYRIYFGE